MVIATALLSLFPAFAEPTVELERPEIESAWRRHPIGAVRVRSGYPDTFGASSSLWPRPFALEAGVAVVSLDTATAYGRVGFAIPLRERARLAARKNRFPAYDLMLAPMGGFRWVDNRGDTPDSRGGVTFTQSADLLIWTNSRAAIDLQATVGGTVWVYREDPNTVLMSPEVAFAAGLAF